MGNTGLGTKMHATLRGARCWIALLVACISYPTLGHGQTRADGQTYFRALEQRMPPDRLKAWQSAPGYAQARSNFLTADFRPTLDAKTQKRLTKQARRAARRDRRCRSMAVVDRQFGDPLGLDRQVERQIDRGELRNAWFYRVDLAGCDERYAANFVVIEQMDKDLTHLTALPGDTLAWPSLQSDVLPKVALTSLQAVRNRDPDCIPSGRDHIIETRLDQGPKSGRAKMFGVLLAGSWSERWTMAICRQEVDLRVAFRADGRGGARFQIQAMTEETKQ